MSSPFFGSTYRKYKEDTSIFVQWLLESAEKCGYVREDPPVADTPEPTKTPRLKGKARKLAKQTPEAPTSSSTPEDGKTPHHRVSASELLRLANAIATSAAPSEIPSSIMRAGLRAISARKRCTDYFRNKTSVENLEESRVNEQHSYFTSLMEEVMVVLQPCFARSVGVTSLATAHSLGTTSTSAQPPTSVSISSVTSIENLMNRFEALEVEQPSEETSDNVSPPEVAHPVFEVVPAISSPEQIVDEKLFAIFCLFHDLNDLRDFLRKVWTDYLDSSESMDLVTASVTTNMAFQLAIRNQEELLAAFPECDADRLEVDDKLAEWIFAPVHSMLDTFCDEYLVPDTAPKMSRGRYGIYDPRADRARMVGAEMQQEDLALLIELLPEFRFLSKSGIKLFATDELTRGLSTMCQTKEIPVWLTFAATVLLDVHHILREEAGRGLQEVQIIGKRSVDMLRSYLDLSKGLKSPSTWPKQKDDHLQKIADTIEAFTLTDGLFHLKSKLPKLWTFGALGAHDRFYLYKRHPIFCGFLKFRIILEMQEHGQALVNAWTSLIYPAHLYNALRQRSGPMKPWRLMEQALAVHGEGQIFIGAAPKTLEASFKQISLMMGFSVTQFARNPRRPYLVKSRHGPRGLKETSAIGTLFKDGFHDTGSFQSMMITMHKVEQLLNEQAAAVEPQRRKWSTPTTLTALELLQALKLALVKDMPKLTFEYFALHEQSITFLRNLRVVCDEDFRRFQEPQYIDDESQLPFLAAYVIMIACVSTKTATGLGYNEDEIYSKVLEKAGETLQSTLEEMQAA